MPKLFTLGFGLVFLTVSFRSAAAPEPAAPRLLEPFDYRGVNLSAGTLKSQVTSVRSFYLSIPDDDLLKGFRARAGLPLPPGRNLGGWYSSDIFHIFGQIISGLSRLYAGTSDTPCLRKANRLITEWSKCIETDGYFYASRRPNDPLYIYDKMLGGLLDNYVYCTNHEALVAMSRITDWAVRNLSRPGTPKAAGTEWYTLSENLYRAYLVTGDSKYRDFAQVWEYGDYWDMYARGDDIFAARPDGSRSSYYHAYSHVNTLGGAAAAYLVKGEARYLQTVINGASYLRNHECFATGGYGPEEQLLPPPGLLDRAWRSRKSFETQCGSWAAFKLCKYLIGFTGDATCGDWIERLVYNGIGASIPMTADGRVFYYSDYAITGGDKENIETAWTCCTGTRIQAVADYRDLIYFHDAQDLYVNLFTPSSVRWSRGTNSITLSQTTSFPETDRVKFTLVLSQPTIFAVKFRVPAWLAQPMTATINGATATLQSDEQHWATLRRRWNSGDVISLRLPLGLWASPLETSVAAPAAALFGPVVLAFETSDPRPLQRLDLGTLNQVLSPIAGKPLNFSLTGNPGIRARPFSSFTQGENYYMYLDPKMAMRIPYWKVKFTGAWGDSGLSRYSNQVGATALSTFTGTGIRWLGQRFDDAGYAEISIDGKFVAKMDQYSPVRESFFDWSYTGLPPGKHTIQLRLMPEIPPNSKSQYLNVSGFEMLE